MDQSRYKDSALLFRDLRKGMESAFDYLFRTRYQQLVAHAAAMIKDMDVARDLVQEVFAAIWNKSANISETTTIDGYLHTCVRNKCIDHIDNVKKYTRTVDYFLDNLRIEDAYEPDVNDYVWLNNAVESLPKQCREILKMKIIDGMKYREVALALRISENTVKTQIRIAYRKIRECTYAKGPAAN